MLGQGAIRGKKGGKALQVEGWLAQRQTCKDCLEWFIAWKASEGTSEALRGESKCSFRLR